MIDIENLIATVLPADTGVLCDPIEVAERLRRELTKENNHAKSISADDEWWNRASKLALGYVIIKACRDCSEPVVDGYCCDFCQSTNP